MFLWTTESASSAAIAVIPTDQWMGVNSSYTSYIRLYETSFLRQLYANLATFIEPVDYKFKKLNEIDVGIAIHMCCYHTCQVYCLLYLL